MLRETSWSEGDKNLESLLREYLDSTQIQRGMTMVEPEIDEVTTGSYLVNAEFYSASKNAVC